MSLARGAVLAGVASAVLASLTFGVAMPASADTGPLFPNATNAADYALSVRGMDIYASQSEAARAAWNPQLARVAAANGNIYRAAQVFGNLDPEQLAEVIPMNGAVDKALNGKLTKGMLVTNGVRGWVGKGFRFPAFSSGVWSGVRNAAGVVGLTAAMYGYEKRGDVANGVLSWVGQDAAGAVCSDPVAGGNNPINWITGQNCDQWAAGKDFVINQGVPTSTTYGDSCSPSKPSNCFHYIGNGAVIGSSGNSPSCFNGNLTGTTNPIALYLTGTRGSQNTPFEQTTTGNYNTSPGAFDGYCPKGTNMFFVAGGDPVLITGYRFDEPGATNGTVTSTVGDPERVIRCTQYGPSGNVTNGYTPAFRQSDVALKGSPQPVCIPLPNGETQNRVVVTQIDPDGETVLQDKTETSAATDYRNNYAAQCGTSATQHSCLLDVVQISNGISCFSATATCTDWFHDSARDTKYQCQFGGKNEPVQQCAILANTFDAAKRAAGNPYADPLTGDDLHTGTGSDLDTQTMGNPAGSVIGSNGSVSSCWGGSNPGAFNPISWIVRGGQCLLNWAFVPRPLVVQERMAVVSTGWEANGIGKLVTAVKGWKINPVVSGCSSNLPFPVPMIHKTIVVPIIQACPGTPMGDFAPWVRGLVSAGLMITAGFAVKRIVSGWIPS